MNKQEFLIGLRDALSGFPQDDVEERIAFYGEMIDDRMEEGMDEEEAVAEVGRIDEIREQIVADIPFTKLVKEKVKPKRALRAWEILLIVLGFPVWFPLLVAACAILLSLYIVVWVLLIALWAIEISLWVCTLGGIAAAIVYFIQGSIPPALMMLGTAFVIAGLSIFLFFGCVEASKGILKLTKKAGVGVKSVLIGKENAK
ncbi:MAG: DUF1700 domain-containing protein [Clostridia bacterium]|nr:DUF1700 domain-containing protein [Clostridia bacterium]